MDYQGFNGSNYAEDDEERKKAGGGISGFKSTPTPSPLPTNSNTDLPLVLENQYNAEEQRLKFKNDNHRNEMLALDKLRNDIYDKSGELERIDDEAANDPRFRDAYKNQSDLNEVEFNKLYPEYNQLLNDVGTAEAQYQNNPLGAAHKAEQLELEKLRNDPKFKAISDVLNSRR